MKKTTLFLSCFFIFNLLQSQVSYTWNGVTSSNWNTSSNWTPNGIPGSADNVTIVSASNNCVISSNTSVSNLTLTSGVLDIASFSFSVTATSAVNSGSINATSGIFYVSGTSATFGTSSGTPYINAEVIVNTNDVYTRKTTYNKHVSFTKNDGTNSNPSSGGNIFNDVFVINYVSTSGTGYLSMGNGSSDIFNSDVYVNNNSLNRIILCHNSNANQFNGNLIFTQTGSSVGSAICWNSGSACTIAATKSIQIGAGGFDAGYLYIQDITQSDNTAVNLTTTGTSEIWIGYGSSNFTTVFSGDVTITAPNIYVRGGTFNGTATFNKTGGTNNHNNGRQNIFNSTLTINQSSTSGYFMLGYNSNDLFNGDIIVSNTGNQALYLGYSAGTGTPTQASGKNVTIGPSGFSDGALYLGGFNQAGSSSVNLTLTGNAALYMVNGSLFNGTVDVTAPSVYVSNSTFNDVVTLTKTSGSSSNSSSGGNTFNSTFTANYNSSSGTGYWGFGNGSADIFNGDVYLNNNSLDRILMCQGSSGNQFNGNVFITQTGSATGMAFGWNSGTSSTIAATKSIQIGGAGFSSGYLYLQGMTQLGNAPITLNTTGSCDVRIGSGNATGASVFGGDVSITAADIYVRGGTFNGTASFTKTGGTSNHNNSQQNIFNSTLTINQQSTTGYFMLGYNSNDLFNGDVVVTNTGSQGLLLGHNNTNTGTPVLAAGKTLSIGPAGFSGGFLNLGNFTQLGTATTSITLSGSAYFQVYEGGTTCTFNGPLYVEAPDVYLKGAIFNDVASFTKTGGIDNNNAGKQNIFNSSFTINQQSTSGYFAVGYNSNDLFNGDIIVTNTGSKQIYIGYSSGTGTPTQAAGHSITIGPAGFSGGTLYFGTFTQLGNSPVSLNFSGTSTLLYFAGNSIFNGAVTANPGGVYFNACTFNSTVDVTKTGSGSETSTGGNVFNGTTTITNNGAGRITLGNTNADQFNASTIFNNTGGERFYFASGHNGQTTTFASDLTLNSNRTSGTDGWSFMVCEGTNTSISVAGNLSINCSGALQSNHRFLNGSGTSATYNGIFTASLTNTHASTALQLGVNGTSSFNDNIIVSNTGGGASSSIEFNIGSASSSTLANSKTITLGAGGFTSGKLGLYRFTQSGGTAQSLIQTSGTGALYLGPASAFGGNVNFNFPQVYLNGTTYSGMATIEKNGATDNAGTGGNVFNGTTIITNSGSGYLMTGNGNADQFNGVTTFNNTGSYRIYFAHSHSGQTTTFAQSLTINANKTGGTDTWSYYIAEGNNTNLTFGGDVVLNIGGTLQSNLRILTGSNTTAIYNGNLNVNLTNSHASTAIQLGTNGTSTYNGNIVVLSTGGSSSGGIYFNTGASSSSTLASGKTITLGAGGFTTGNLSLLRFTQLGSTPQTLSQTSGTAILTSGSSSTFNGNVDFNFPQVFLNGTTYNGSASIQKNGATNNASTGGNVFNGNTILTNTGTGYYLMANSSSDAYNSDVTFIQNNSGPVYPNYNTNCTYSGNISVTSSGTYTITFGVAGSGIATLTGSNAQTINKSGTVGYPVFTRLVVNKSSNDVTLNTRVNISSSLTLTQGIINTTQTNILNMNNASSTSVGNSLSYINGPMNYDMALNGARTLNFPIGKSGDWRPAVLSATHNSGTSYTYNSEVFNSSAEALGWTKPASVDLVSLVHWWDITRTNTSTGVNTPTTNLSGNQTITLYYGANDGVTDPTNLTICKNTYTATNAWIDIGGSGATITSGNITSTSAPSAFNSFSRFTLGNKVGGINPLPIELLSFQATPVDHKKVLLEWATASEKNNDHFEVERSTDGVNFEYLKPIKAYGNGTSTTKQTYSTPDTDPYTGISYYRLKQVDQDGKYTYSNVVSVNLTENEGTFTFYPNPLKFNETLNVSLNVSKGEEVLVVLYGPDGKEVYSKVILTQQEGENVYAIDLEGKLSSGIYLVTATSKQAIYKRKLIIQ